jgi:hypothetical protein
VDYRPQIYYIPVFLVLLFYVYFVVTRTGLLVVVNFYLIGCKIRVGCLSNGGQPAFVRLEPLRLGCFVYQYHCLPISHT